MGPSLREAVKKLLVASKAPRSRSLQRRLQGLVVTARMKKVPRREAPWDVVIPHEIWALIFSYMDPHTSLLNVRLVCRTFERAATNTFMTAFDDRVLYLTETNLVSLELLWRRFRSTSTIRTLRLEPSHLHAPNRAALINWNNETELQSSHEQTMYAYHTWCFLEGYQSMRNLEGSFQRLMRSTFLKNGRIPSCWTVLPSAGSALVRFHAETQGLHDEMMRSHLLNRFFTHSLFPNTSICKNLTTLKITASIRVDQLPSPAQTHGPIFPNLTYLHLRLTPDTRPGTAWDMHGVAVAARLERLTKSRYLSKFLNSMPKLNTLELVAPLAFLQKPSKMWSLTTSAWVKEMGDYCHFPALQELTLMRFHFFDEENLTRFLHKHRTTLRFFRAISLQTPDWRRFYDFVVAEMNLTFHDVSLETTVEHLRGFWTWRFPEEYWGLVAKSHEKRVTKIQYQIS